MEVLATAAAAAQLVAYGLKLTCSICELRERTRNAPRRFAQYARHMELLVIITRDIGSNPDLQSTTVNSFLSATLAETEAAQIIVDRFLKGSSKRRYLGVVNGKLDRSIIEHLDNLDRTVTAFCLCISSMTTKQVEQLTRDMGRLRLQLNPEPAQPTGEVVRYQNQSAHSKIQHSRTKWKERRAKLSMDKPTMPEPVVNSTGTSTYSNFKFKDCRVFTVGNTVDGKTDPTPARKIAYSNFQIDESYGFQIGDTGQTSGDSSFDDFKGEGNQAFYVGPYNSLDAKQKHLSQMLETAEAIS